jgi:hypothetical protein
MPVNNYHHILHNFAEERWSHLLRGESLKSSNVARTSNFRGRHRNSLCSKLPQTVTIPKAYFPKPEKYLLFFLSAETHPFSFVSAVDEATWTSIRGFNNFHTTHARGRSDSICCVRNEISIWESHFKCTFCTHYRIRNPVRPLIPAAQPPTRRWAGPGRDNKQDISFSLDRSSEAPSLYTGQ